MAVNLQNTMNKEKIKKAAKRKNGLRLISSLLNYNIRSWKIMKQNNIVQLLIISNCQPRFLYQAKLSFNGDDK